LDENDFCVRPKIGVLSSSTAAQYTPQERKKEVHLVAVSTPRERQIELALSAAPTEVSRKATIYILGAKGYEKVREGTSDVPRAGRIDGRGSAKAVSG
jgi:hypothetical protein